MARKSRLEGRLTSILSRHTNRAKITHRATLAVACLLAMLAPPVAMMRAAADQEATTTENPSSGIDEIEQLSAQWAEKLVSGESSKIPADALLANPIEKLSEQLEEFTKRRIELQQSKQSIEAQGLGSKHPAVITLRQRTKDLDQAIDMIETRLGGVTRIDAGAKKPADPDAPLDPIGKLGAKCDSYFNLLKSGLGPNHPRLVKLKAEIDTLGSQMEPAPPRQLTKMLPLKHAEANAIKKVIDQQLRGSQGGHVIADPETNSLTYLGDGVTLELVQWILERLDRPASSNAENSAKAHQLTKVLPLKHAEASTTKKTIDQQLRGSPRGRVIIDPETNSLIYLGDTMTLELVQWILDRLDRPASSNADDSTKDERP